MVKKTYINDRIFVENGRIIGLKAQNLQVWNIYPKSGSEFKKNREIFFSEKLCNYMALWKDNTKYIFQAGDHNCTHRREDSLNNPAQHLQHGLVKHLKNYGIQDDFLILHGQD